MDAWPYAPRGPFPGGPTPEPRRLTFCRTNGCDFYDNNLNKGGLDVFGGWCCRRKSAFINIGPHQDLYGWQCCEEHKTMAVENARAWQQRHYRFPLLHVLTQNQLEVDVRVRRTSGDVEVWSFDLIRVIYLSTDHEILIPMISKDEKSTRLTRISSLEELNPVLHELFVQIREYADVGKIFQDFKDDGAVADGVVDGVVDDGVAAAVAAEGVAVVIVDGTAVPVPFDGTSVPVVFDGVAAPVAVKSNDEGIRSE